jgi:hypothetical protein
MTAYTNKNEHGMGYIPSPVLPTDKVYPVRPERLEKLATSIDLRNTATTPVLNQDGVGSCCSHACVGIFEWLQVAIIGSYTMGSALALYRWARDVDGFVGDIGSTFAGNLSTITQIGLPPNSAYPWPFQPDNPNGGSYNANLVNAEPSTAVKNAAAPYKITNEGRINVDADNHTTNGLNKLKAVLSTPVTDTNPKTGESVTLPGLPSVIGFAVCNGFDQTGSDGNVGMPQPGEVSRGGHANGVYGYNDTHANNDGSHGALLLKNSWGTGWGAGGWSWMPYNYAIGGWGGMTDTWVIRMESELVPTAATPKPASKVATGPVLNINIRVRSLQPGWE